MGLLDGKVAAVTGAGAGLGEGSALRLAAAGAAVVVNDLDPDAAQAVARRVVEEGGQALAVPGDIGEEGLPQALVDAAVKAFGGLDVMHANAGVERYKPLEETTTSDMDYLLDVDLKAALRCASVAIPQLRLRGGGSIVFTSSVQATHGLPGCVVYAAAKAGLVAAARTLAVEVGPDAIRVNTVSPGTHDTPMFRRNFEHYDTEDAKSVIDSVAAANALGRIGTADDIGNAVVFLVSEMGAYVTGTNLVVDGGFSAVKKM
jgi:NAD(P)-dependent dehydrogenase (short-subunit alcohol dehydrogenase family)